MIRGISIDLGKNATAVVTWEGQRPVSGEVWSFNYTETVPHLLYEFRKMLLEKMFLPTPPEGFMKLRVR